MEFNIKLSQNQISQILINLAKEPYENVFLLISEIQQQANQQLESVEVD